MEMDPTITCIRFVFLVPSIFFYFFLSLTLPLPRYRSWVLFSELHLFAFCVSVCSSWSVADLVFILLCWPRLFVALGSWFLFAYVRVCVRACVYEVITRKVMLARRSPTSFFPLFKPHAVNSCTQLYTRTYTHTYISRHAKSRPWYGVQGNPAALHGKAAPTPFVTHKLTSIGQEQS